MKARFVIIAIECQIFALLEVWRTKCLWICLKLLISVKLIRIEFDWDAVLRFYGQSMVSDILFADNFTWLEIFWLLLHVYFY